MLREGNRERERPTRLVQGVRSRAVDRGKISEDEWLDSPLPRFWTFALVRYFVACTVLALGPVALGWATEWRRSVLWLAAVLGYRMVEQLGYTPRLIKGERRAAWLFFLLYPALVGAVLLPAAEFALRARALSAGLVSLGMFCVGAGTWLRYLSVKTLGKHFSVHVEVRPGHQLVDWGIFRHIRHPGYAGVMVFSVGAALILSAFFSLIFILCVFWPLVLARMRIEEEELARSLSGYAEYMERSKRLVPHLF